MENEPLRTPESIIDSYVMSEVELIAFVEGKNNDPYTYEKIYHNAAQQAGLSTEKVAVLTPSDIDLTSLDLPQAIGGKTACIAIHDHLKDTSYLMSRESYGKHYVLINLDKDVDDLTSNLLESDHIIYTEYYDLEAQVLMSHSPKEIIQELTSITSHAANSMFSGVSWHDVILPYIEWHNLCCLSQLRNGGLKGFSSSCVYITSVRNGLGYSIDTARRDGYIAALARSLSIEETDIETEVDAIIPLIERFDRLKLFKGKWLPVLLGYKVGERSSDTILLETEGIVARAGHCVKSFGKLLYPWPSMNAKLNSALAFLT